MVAIAEVLRAAGYRTSPTGKWQLETRLEASMLGTAPESGKAAIWGGCCDSVHASADAGSAEAELRYWKRQQHPNAGSRPQPR